MKRRGLLLWAAFVLILVAVELAIVTRVLRFDPTNFYFIVVAIAVIGILAIIGAAFIGIFLTTRILSSRDFTPFEREMLGMREDVRKLAAKVEELTTEGSADPPTK